MERNCGGSGWNTKGISIGRHPGMENQPKQHEESIHMAGLPDKRNLSPNEGRKVYVGVAHCWMSEPENERVRKASKEDPGQESQSPKRVRKGSTWGREPKW